MKVRFMVLTPLLALAAATAIARADTKPAAPNVARFESLKKLAGDWLEVGENGKPSDTVGISIKVIAGGTAIQETEQPGTDHEMVTIYHMDGPDLVLTHYCVLGNQPHMKAVATGSPDKIEFKFAGASNLKSPDEMHMDHVTLTFVDSDHYRAEWAACQGGKECHKGGYTLQRKTASAGK